MYIRDLPFLVEFSHYAEAHFCKDFYKKFSARQWIETKKTITETLQRAFFVQQTDLIDILRFSQEEQRGIFKFDFKVAGTNQSPKSSGNRAIFTLCNKTGKIEVLLVYEKRHCSKKGTENQWIFGHIKGNFPEHRKLL